MTSGVEIEFNMTVAMILVMLLIIFTIGSLLLTLLAIKLVFEDDLARDRYYG